MLEKEMADLRVKLDAIAAEGTVPEPPNWRKTPIKGWEHGFIGEAQAIRQKEWWNKPREEAGQSLAELLRAKGYGPLKTSDGKEEENRQFHPEGREHGVSGSEIAELQRKKEKAAVEDSEQYEKYLPASDDSIWHWCDQLPVEVNITAESQPWYDALRSYVHKFPRGTRAADVDAETIAQLVKQICEASHAQAC